MRTRFVILLCAATAVVLGTTGCDEISARRKVQDGNDEYKNGKYEEAAKDFEEALAKKPGLCIAQHNLGVTYFKLMGEVGSEDDVTAVKDEAQRSEMIAQKTRDYADKATTQLEAYLKCKPDPKEVVLLQKLVTEIWMDSDQVDKAITFWEGQHTERPQDTDVLDQLAGLNNKKGDWKKAIEWLNVWVQTAQEPDSKAEAYQKIGNLCFLRLLSNPPSSTEKPIRGKDRIELADIGTAALQQAHNLSPKNPQILSVLASMNQQRALAEGSHIGFQIDLANHQNLMRQFSVLSKQAQEEAAKAAAAQAEAGGDTGGGS